MKKYLFIVLFVGFGFAQDSYPYFSDPNKQTKFEDNRVYIIEKSGKELHYSGGESYTELANTWGYILLDESPEYVVKQTPLKTHYEYYYEFKIKKGTKTLNELEFLLEAGYNVKAKEIYNIYEEKMVPYKEQYAIYEKEINNYLENNKKIEKHYVRYGKSDCFAQYFLGSCAMIYAVPYIETAVFAGIGMLITYFIPTKEKKVYDTISKPTPPSEPTLGQVLTNEQIKSLAESYNRRIYEEIKVSK